MAFELNSDGAYVFYLNFRQLGTGINECDAEQNFTFTQLIEDASKYICAIERFRIPVQSVPMQEALNNAIILRDLGAGPDIIINTTTSYSMYEWMLQINSALSPLQISLTSDGRLSIDNFDFDAHSIELSPIVQAIFAFPDPIINLNGIQTISGAVPIFDRFDQFFKLQIECLNGLSNLQQEIQDTNTFTTILTDFIIPSNFTASNTNTLGAQPNGNINFSFQVRQDLEFNASTNRRFVMFRGASPIQNVRVRVVSIYRDGSRHPIILPQNSVFELKLAFYRKGEITKSTR